MDEAEDRAWIALSLCAAGRPDQWLALARALGSAAAAVAADDGTLATQGASPAAVALLRRAAGVGLDRAVARCRRLGLRVVTQASPAYPDALRTLVDAPLALYCRGADLACAAPRLAVVGSRRATAYGERVARDVAREAAAAGIVVVSGLARGIDAAAHRGALEAGRTDAVLAGGLDRVYPAEHASLARTILDRGGTVLSEQPPGATPRPWLFPFRNRILTGLSAATVVVEAAEPSGSRASAMHALAQGRDVFAVPGPIDSPTSHGTNRLLRDGAHLFLEVSDLAVVDRFSQLGRRFGGKGKAQLEVAAAALEPGPAAVLAAVRAGATVADEVALRTGFDGARVLAFLTALELDGLVQRDVFGRFGPALR